MAITEEDVRFTPEEERRLLSSGQRYLEVEAQIKFDHFKKHVDKLRTPIGYRAALEALFFLTNDYTRWESFKYLTQTKLTPTAYNRCLKRAYSFGKQMTDALFFFSFSSMIDRTILMTKQERLYLDSLPDEFVVYRGTSLQEFHSRKKGISYSTDRGVAESFAFCCYNPQNKVVMATKIKKSEVLAYFNHRHEREILFDPKGHKFEIVCNEPTQAYYEYMDKKKL